MAEKPWLILTLRRTGGTTLSKVLRSLSSFPACQDEPFNPERAFGHVTKAYRASQDKDALRRDIEGVLEERRNIKHCFEFLSLDLTSALIDVAVEKGYQLVVLTRRNEARRISSLLLAQATAAWGAETAEDRYPLIESGTLVPDPIALERVKPMVRQASFAIGQVLMMLRNRKIDYDWIVFEEIYHSEDPTAERVRALAANLGIDVPQGDPRLDLLAPSGAQKSFRIEDYVPNYSEAMAIVDQAQSSSQKSAS